MYLYFNSNGQLLEILEHGSPARSGTTEFEIFAFFEGVDIETSYTTASLTLFKPDLNNTAYPALLMERKTVYFEKMSGENLTHFTNNTNYKGFYFNFHDFTSTQTIETLLDTVGNWQASIRLYGSNRSIYVQGQFNFPVAGGIQDEDGTEMSMDSILSNINLAIAAKLDIDSTAYLRVISSIPAAGSTFNADAFNIGDILYNKADKSFYKLESLTVYEGNPIKLGLNLADLTLADESKIVLLNGKHIATTEYVDASDLLKMSKQQGIPFYQNLFSGIGNTEVQQSELKQNEIVFDVQTGTFYKYANNSFKSVKSNLFVSENISSLLDLSKFANGQLIFVSNSSEKKLYEINNASQSLVFDFNNYYTKTQVDTLLAGKVNKVSGTYKVYATDGTGADTSINYANDKDANTIAYRDVNGRIRVATPDDPDDAVNKSYADNIKTIAQNAIPKTDIVDNLTTASSTKVLSAKQGKLLEEKIENLESRGRFLAIWNASLGQPSDLPGGVEILTEQYNFRSGDYYVVGTAGSKFPTGSNLPIGTTIANFPYVTITDTASANDTIYYDGTNWSLLSGGERTVSFSNIAGSPYDNTNLGGALNDKQNQITYSLDEPVGAENGDVWGYEGIDTSDVAIGNGLEITETSGGTRVLGIDGDITATKTDLTSKLDKNTETGSNRVYGINENGEQTTYIISQEVISERIIQRDSGGRAKVATPVENDDITNKQYVDEGLGSKANTADLADVATSGSYDDLDDKPHLYRHDLRINSGDYTFYITIYGDATTITNSNISTKIPYRISAAVNVLQAGAGSVICGVYQNDFSYSGVFSNNRTTPSTAVCIYGEVSISSLYIIDTKTQIF